MPTHYETLGVAPNADEKTIKQAFRKLALSEHPDTKARNKASEEERGKAEEDFKAINAAYAILNNPVTRNQYDNELLDQKSMGGAGMTNTSDTPDTADTDTAAETTHSNTESTFNAYNFTADERAEAKEYIRKQKIFCDNLYYSRHSEYPPESYYHSYDHDLDVQQYLQHINSQEEQEKLTAEKQKEEKETADLVNSLYNEKTAKNDLFILVYLSEDVLNKYTTSNDYWVDLVGKLANNLPAFSSLNDLKSEKSKIEQEHRLSRGDTPLILKIKQPSSVVMDSNIKRIIWDGKFISSDIQWVVIGNTVHRNKTFIDRYPSEAKKDNHGDINQADQEKLFTCRKNIDSALSTYYWELNKKAKQELDKKYPHMINYYHGRLNPLDTKEDTTFQADKAGDLLKYIKMLRIVNILINIFDQNVFPLPQILLLQDSLKRTIGDSKVSIRDFIKDPTLTFLTKSPGEVCLNKIDKELKLVASILDAKKTKIDEKTATAADSKKPK
jgi:curved DNA-binding protein CbpA